LGKNLRNLADMVDSGNTFKRNWPAVLGGNRKGVQYFAAGELKGNGGATGETEEFRMCWGHGGGHIRGGGGKGHGWVV